MHTPLQKRPSARHQLAQKAKGKLSGGVTGILWVIYLSDKGCLTEIF